MPRRSEGSPPRSFYDVGWLLVLLSVAMPVDRWREGDDLAEEPREVARPRGPEPRVGEGRQDESMGIDRPRIGSYGSWEWKGLRLERSDNETADQGLARRREIEPAITRDMRSIEAGLDHGRLIGCPAHTLKSPDRFKEKLAKRITDRPDISPAEHEREIHDGIRYGFSIDDEHYASTVGEIRDKLQELGYELQLQENHWANPQYEGINSRWIEPRHGQLVEIQFHTPTSWNVDQATHEIYENIKNPTTSPQTREAFRAEQEAMSRFRLARVRYRPTTPEGIRHERSGQGDQVLRNR
jgi:hypothetical protein